MELLRRRNVHSVLLPGNGCSLLPHVLLHIGFDVTVVDISSVANEAVRKVRPNPEQFSFFLAEWRSEQEKMGTVNGPIQKLLDLFGWRSNKEITGTYLIRDKEASLRRVEREAKAGGSLEIITSDIRVWQSPKTFDAIYDDRLMTVLPQDSWPATAHRYYDWLTPHGICIVHTLNLGGTFGDDVSPVRKPFEASFLDAGFAEMEYGSKEVAKSQERTVLFLHASG